MTAIDMYKLTLELLNKSHNSSVTPDEWMLLVNSKQIDFVLSNYEKYRLNQSIYDRLQPIIKPATIINTGVAIAGQETFPLPYDTIPALASGFSRGYLRMLKISGKVNYVNDPCIADGLGVDYEPLFLMDDDQQTVSKRNPYRRPKTSRMYYEVINNIVTVHTGSQNYITEIKIKYLRYPRAIDLSQSPGTGDCELPIDMRNDLSHLVVKTLIELIESGRYPTFTNEVNQQINN